ncbi:hypothetical protein M0813_13996 [Anaeramoeba flamelloides]|uniref:Uncharacterized protein n=1 Tax=Anaeramoeba flamelloides TaxID=1746091 RepID=A0ABQ8Z738_9EUKA|nr:hypothetical protein M0813_13996 [Anaeramoeba flamelloides]
MKLSLEIDILDETTQYLTNTKPNKLIKELIKTIFKQISHENSTDLEKKIIMKQEDLKSLIQKLEKLDPNDVKELEKKQPIYSESLIFFESPLDFYISRRMIGKNLERLKNYPPSQFEALFSIVFEIANDSEKIYEGRSTNPNESYMSTRIMFIPKRIDAKDQFTMRAMWAVLQRESPNWKSKILNRLGFRISNSHFEREKEHYQQRVQNSLRATQKKNIQRRWENKPYYRKVMQEQKEINEKESENKTRKKPWKCRNFKCTISFQTEKNRNIHELKCKNWEYGKNFREGQRPIVLKKRKRKKKKSTVITKQGDSEFKWHDMRKRNKNGKIVRKRIVFARNIRREEKTLEKKIESDEQQQFYNIDSDDDLTFEELSDENGIEENSKVLILDPEKQWNLGWIHCGNLLTRYSSPNLKVSLSNDQLEEKENKRLNTVSFTFKAQNFNEI